MSLISYLTRIHFADGVLEDALAEELAGQGVTRPLVLTDDDTGPEAAERLEAALPHGAAGRLRLPGGPLRARDVLDAAPLRDDADGVIGLGGPAAIDAARLLGLAPAAALARLLAGEAMPMRHRGDARRDRRPVVAVPTGAAGGLGLIPGVWVAGADGRGQTVSGACLIPAALLCDPTLGAESPPAARAAAGMDALALCIETWLGTGWNPPADGMALDGIRRAWAHLEASVRNPADIEARREVLAAGLNGGLAAQKGLGALTALVRALQAGGERRAGLHAALLPGFLAFNAPAVGHRYGAIAAAMGLSGGDAVGPALAGLGAALGLPARLAPSALDPALLPRIALAAEAEPSTRTNPRLASARDYLAMLEAVA